MTLYTFRANRQFGSSTQNDGNSASFTRMSAFEVVRRVVIHVRWKKNNEEKNGRQKQLSDKGHLLLHEMDTKQTS